MLGRDVLMGCMIMQAAAKTRLGSRPEKAIGLGFGGEVGRCVPGDTCIASRILGLPIWGDGNYWRGVNIGCITRLMVIVMASLQR